MPKKLSTNTKAVEAREKKATAQKQKELAEEKRKEDGKVVKCFYVFESFWNLCFDLVEKWIDDDKSLAKKLDRKQEEERKKAEALKKKADAKALLEQEEESLKVAAKLPLTKITRIQIEKEVENRNKNIENVNNPQKPAEPKVAPIEENLNRVMADVHVASSIDQAISVLKVGDSEEDRHPEKRMKAAFKAYEDLQIPIMRAQNPSLKLSQVKQLVFKSWQKAPENPINRVNWTFTSLYGTSQM